MTRPVKVMCMQVYASKHSMASGRAEAEEAAPSPPVDNVIAGHAIAMQNPRNYRRVSRHLQAARLAQFHQAVSHP